MFFYVFGKMANLQTRMISPAGIYIGVFFLVVGAISAAEGSAPPKSKRQIYREQVLPSKGGKIPEAAFRTDRLALNRLNKEGISIPDGVLLEHRVVHSHPHINQHDPEDEESLIKIIQRPDDRYAAEAGKFHPKGPLTVSSTYIIRKPIGPESTAIRVPLPREQSSYHETLSQYQGNQLHQFYPDSYYQHQHSQSYEPTPFPPKYLPAELTAPPQKYLPIESLAPKYVEIPASKHLSAQLNTRTPTSNVVHHPHPYGYSTPVSYQQVHQSVAYNPIYAPLELPNKDILKDEYYTIKGQGTSYGSQRDPQDIHSVVDWPYLLKQYTRLSDKINVLDQESYVQPTPHSLFFTPQVLGSVDPSSSYYETRDRYARKSKEIAFTDSPPAANGKPRPKDSRRLIKLKCTSRLENTVEDGSSQCYIRY